MGYSRGNWRKFKCSILRLKITFLFYGEFNGGYLEGNALLAFQPLNTINPNYISVTLKQKHCEIDLQVSL